MANAAARCRSHDLAVGPDGRCVLCAPASYARSYAQDSRLGTLAGGLGESLAGLGETVAAVAAVAASTPFALTPRAPAAPTADGGRARARAEATSEGIWWLPVGIASGLGLVVLLTAVSGIYLYSTVQASDAAHAPGPSVAVAANSGVLGSREASTENGAEGSTVPVARGAAAGVSIELYGATWCPACRAAKAWLESHHIAFTEYDVDRDRAAGVRLRTLNPRGSIPVIVVEGSAPMVGFNATQIEAAIARATTK